VTINIAIIFNRYFDQPSMKFVRDLESYLRKEDQKKVEIKEDKDKKDKEEETTVPSEKMSELSHNQFYYSELEK